MPIRALDTFFTNERLRGYVGIWLAIAGTVYCIDLLQQTEHGLTDGRNRPFGDDFLNYWSGAVLAARGMAAEVYDFMAFHAFQQRVVGAGIQLYHYSYPPVLLVLSLPLAALPYVPALFVWLVGSWAAFAAALRSVLSTEQALLFSLATPALFVNAAGGQNGALTAACLGGGLTLLERRPVLAGILLGVLAYKPHLGILLPFALLAGGYWRSYAAAAATVLLLVLASLALHGPKLWLAYFQNADLVRQVILEDGTGVWHRMVSVFVFVRRLGAEIWLAYALQIAAGLAATAIVVHLWRGRAPLALKNAALVLATFLATPYLQDYDLVVCTFVAAWLYNARAALPGFAPNRPVLALLILLPLLAAAFGRTTGLSLGAPVIAAGFIALLAALRAGRRAAEAPEDAPDDTPGLADDGRAGIASESRFA